MNNRPLYENLDTAFVNLSALVKYLRHREFIGRIRVELNSYEADITLYEGNKISVREHDKISGRIADGEEAFQRLVIRSREAGGTIHVYQTVKQTNVPVVEKPVQNAPVAKPETQVNKNPVLQNAVAQTANGQSVVPMLPPEAVKILPVSPALNVVEAKTKTVEATKKPNQIVNQPKFPFALHNNVELKVKQSQLSSEDWQTLLGLTGELLNTIDKTLAESNLDFTLAFVKVRTEISEDYPFLKPANNVFEYDSGKIIMHTQVNSKVFVTSINEALKRIFDRLGANPKFAEVYRNTVQKTLALIHKREYLYDQFGFTQLLKRTLGV